MNVVLSERQNRAAKRWPARKAWWTWPLAGLLAGSLGGYALAGLWPATYISRAALEWKQPAQTGAGTATEAASAAGSESPADSRMTDVVQRALTLEHLASLAGQFGLYSGEKTVATPADPVARVRRDLAVIPTERGFRVSFSARDPHLAQRICSALVALLVEANPPLRPAAESAVQDSLATQIQEAKRRLNQQETRLAEFKRRHPGGIVEGDSSPALILTALHAQLVDTQAALDKATQEKSLVETLLRQQLVAWHSAQSAPVANTQPLEQELSEKRAQLATLETRYTPDYPDVVKLRNDIAVLQKKLDDVRKSAAPPPPQNPDAVLPGEPAQVAATRAQLHQLDLTIQDKTRERQRLELEIQAAEARGQTNAALAEELESLTSAWNAAQSAYDAVVARQKLAEATAAEQARSTPQLQVVATPSLPSEPAFPNRTLLVLSGAGGGFILGLLGVAIGGWRNSAVRTEADVERFLGLPTLAVIPTTVAQAGSVQEGVQGPGRTGAPGEREEKVLAGH